MLPENLFQFIVIIYFPGHTEKNNTSKTNKKISLIGFTHILLLYCFFIDGDDVLQTLN